MSTAPEIRPAAPPDEGGAFIAAIQDLADELAARNTPVAVFVAEHVADLARLARYFGASDPLTYIERKAIADDDVRTGWYETGRAHGRQEGRSEGVDHVITTLQLAIARDRAADRSAIR